MNQNSDFATVISICPFPIHEFKPGLFPATFSIPAVPEGGVETLIVGNRIIVRQRVPVIGNILEIPVPAVQVAKSIVDDRLTGQLLIKEGSRPGLFWVPGEYNNKEAAEHFAPQIADARMIQKQWFLDLVIMADDDWNKTHQHRFISDLQRYACRILGLNRPWSTETVDNVQDKRCLACYSPMHAKATICPTCKTNQIEFADATSVKIPVAAAKE